MNFLGWLKNLFIKKHETILEFDLQKPIYPKIKQVSSKDEIPKHSLKVQYPIVIPAIGSSNSDILILPESDVTRGVSELFFLDYFRSISKLSILHNPEIQYINKKYFPDFVVKHGDSIVTIEIDEPYALENKIFKPIHYTELDKISSNNLNSLGITTIRFAEEQIIKYPESCVRFIENIIDGNEFKFDHKISRWSKNDCEKMILEKHRDSYLPLPLNDSGYSEKSYKYRSLRIESISNKYKDPEKFVLSYFFNNKTYKTFVLKDDFFSKLKSSEFYRIAIKFDFIKTHVNQDITLLSFADKFIRINGLAKVNNEYINFKSYELTVADNIALKQRLKEYEKIHLEAKAQIEEFLKPYRAQNLNQ